MHGHRADNEQRPTHRDSQPKRKAIRPRRKAAGERTRGRRGAGGAVGCGGRRRRTGRGGAKQAAKAHEGETTRPWGTARAGTTVPPPRGLSRHGQCEAPPPHDGRREGCDARRPTAPERNVTECNGTGAATGPVEGGEVFAQRRQPSRTGSSRRDEKPRTGAGGAPAGAGCGDRRNRLRRGQRARLKRGTPERARPRHEKAVGCRGTSVPDPSEAQKTRDRSRAIESASERLDGRCVPDVTPRGEGPEHTGRRGAQRRGTQVRHRRWKPRHGAAAGRGARRNPALAW